MLRFAAVLATLLAIVPIIYLLDSGRRAGLARAWEILGRADIVELTLRSLGLSLTVGLLAGLIGTATAWLCECTDLAGRRWWHVALVAPIAIPSYVAAYAWVSVDRGFASLWGAVIVLTGVTYPLVHLNVTASLRRIDPALEEVATSLGWPPMKVTRRLLLPQLRRAIGSGVLLSCLYVLADFGAVATMRLQVFTWVIHGAYKASFDPNRAAVLASVLCLLAIGLVFLESLVRGPATASRVGSGAIRERAPIELKGWAAPVHVTLATLSGVALGFPVVRSVQWILPGGSEVTAGEFFGALGTTLALGATVAAFTIALGIPIGWLAARHPSPSSIAAERSVLVAHSLPGIVVALSFVYLGTRALLPIYQEWPIVVLGLGSLMIALAVGTLRTAFEQQSLALIHAAQSSGLSELRTIARVGLPLAWPAIAAGIAIVALHTAKELPMTLLLRPSGSETLATRLWNWAGISDDASVGPYALALILLSVPPTILLAVRDTRRPDRSVTS